MAYTPTVWKNGEAPAINAENLNKMEQGIADANTAANNALEKAGISDNILPETVEIGTIAEKTVQLSESWTAYKALLVTAQYGTSNDFVTAVINCAVRQPHRHAIYIPAANPAKISFYLNGLAPSQFSAIASQNCNITEVRGLK